MIVIAPIPPAPTSAAPGLTADALPLFPTPAAEHAAFVLLRANEALGEPGRSHAAIIRDEIARRNLRLVVSIARRYCRKPSDLPVLAAEGSFGLAKAIRKFNPHRRNAEGGWLRFSTYATRCIKRIVRRSARSLYHAVHLPDHLDGKPADHPLVVKAARVASVRSLDAPIGGLFGDPAGPTGAGSLAVDGRPLPDDETAARDELALGNEHVAGLLRFLSPVEHDVICRRFGIGIPGGSVSTLESIAAWYGMTKENVRQIEGDALDKIRRAAGLMVVAGIGNAEKFRRKRRGRGIKPSEDQIEWGWANDGL